MSEEKVNIGNYKGVMLCNRPNQPSDNSKRNRAFISRVDPKEPVGWNPVTKMGLNNTKPKPKEILIRHKKWLNKIQENRTETFKQNENIEKQKTKKKQKFLQSMGQQRKKLLNAADPEEKKRILLGEDEKGSFGKNKSLSQTMDSNAQKPKWAMTEEEAEKHESTEVDDLLKFVEELDYEEYVKDLEVRTALEFVKEKVTKMIESNPDMKEKFIAKREEKKKKKLEAKTTKSEAVDHQEDWNKSVKEEDPAKKYRKLVKNIADKILKENPYLKAIHSNSSIRRLMENQIISSLGAPPPVMSVVKEKSTRKDLVDASNLPYLHRNPAV